MIPNDDELSRMRDEVLRARFCELLWEASGRHKTRYLAWLELLAESRVPVDAMRYHIRALRDSMKPMEPLPETESQRAARLALERAAAFREGD